MNPTEVSPNHQKLSDTEGCQSPECPVPPDPLPGAGRDSVAMADAKYRMSENEPVRRIVKRNEPWDDAYFLNFS